MPTYANGRWPASALVWFWAKNQYGRLERFRATPGTAARIKAAIADAKSNYGFDLYITSGPNVYRDYDQQVQMEIEHGLGAATPGTSSHGGYWEGRITMAVDFWNARAFQNIHGRAEFNRLMKRHGLTPFLISTARGYARSEPWHCVDLSPLTMPAGAADTHTDAPDDGEEEEEDMALKAVYYKKGKTYFVAFFDSLSGLWSEYNTTTPEYNNELALALKTGNYGAVTESHFNALKRDMATLRDSKGNSVAKAIVSAAKSLAEAIKSKK